MTRQLGTISEGMATPWGIPPPTHLAHTHILISACVNIFLFLLAFLC